MLKRIPEQFHKGIHEGVIEEIFGRPSKAILAEMSGISEGISG